MKQFVGFKTAIVKANTTNRFVTIQIKAILKMAGKTEMPLAMPISMSAVATIDLCP